MNAPTDAPAADLTTVDPETLGLLASQALPAQQAWAVSPVTGDAPVPGTEAQAVAADLADGSRLVVVVAKALGRQVQVGPPPADDLVEGLTPAVDAMAAQLLAEHGPGFERGEVVEVDASAALRPGPGLVAVAAALHDGDEHVATVALLTATPPAAPAEPEAAPPHEFAPLAQSTPTELRSGLELLHDVEMGVTAELGRTRMLVRDVLALAPGSVIELDRAADSPVDVLVNGTLIARGEVVVIDEEFGIRITEVIGYGDGSAHR